MPVQPNNKLPKRHRNNTKQNETDFKQTAEKKTKTKLIYGWQSHIYRTFLVEYAIKLLKYNEF